MTRASWWSSGIAALLIGSAVSWVCAAQLHNLTGFLVGTAAIAISLAPVFLIDPMEESEL